MIAAAAVVLGLAPAAHADHRTRLKVCAYNVDDSVVVEVDGERVGTFPRDGSCERTDVSPGSHRVSARGGSSLSSGEVFNDGRSYAFYDLPETVRVDRGDQTRVNLYFF